MARSFAPIGQIRVRFCEFPTGPQSDGTLQWDKISAVIVEVDGGGQTGVGLSYASAASATIVREVLRPLLLGQEAFDIPKCWELMVASLRNLGRPGVGSLAVSAVDLALWDLKARLLGMPLARLIGQVRADVPVYGSGGLTSFSEAELCREIEHWRSLGIRRAKIKIGREPAQDPHRVRVARDAFGAEGELYVDANGAYDAAQALGMAQRLSDLGVTWFEEPISSDDPEPLRVVKNRLPSGMRLAAGEYGFDPWYFKRMLEAQAVDVLQADATRCLGGTGFLRAAALADAFMVPLSSHCAPSMHAHFACCVPRFESIECFHEHVRIENLIFEGAFAPRGGVWTPDLSSPGNGLLLKEQDLQEYAA